MFIGFAGADADDTGDGVDEDFTVTDFSGSGGFDDCGGGFFGFFGFDANLYEDFRYESNIHLRAAIAFGVAHLPAKAFALDGGDAKDADFGKSLFDGVDFVRLDDGFNHLHGSPLAINITT